MNYAENLLCGDDDAVAVIEMNEQNLGSPRKYTWKELRQLVAKYAGILHRAGLKQGEVVVCKSPTALWHIAMDLGLCQLIISQ